MHRHKEAHILYVQDPVPCRFQALRRGPLYSGKRTFAQRLPGTRIAEVQALAAEAEDLEKLAEELSAYDIVMATEVGGGVVPMDAGERAAREAAGRGVQVKVKMTPR